MFKELFVEAKMTDSEVLSAAKRLAKTGDDKAKKFAQGLIDYYKTNNSFHPNQVSGLQNIMKNASFQLAEGSDIQKIADAIKGKSLFDMGKSLKAAGFKTSSMGYSVLKVSKGANTWYIASDKNADAGDGDITQDGYIIGAK